MSTPRQWIDHAAASLEAAVLFYGHGTNSPEDEAFWLVMSGLGLPFDCPEAQLDQPIDAAGELRLQSLLDARIQTRKPLAYLLNEAWFCGHRFHVDERVLIPRSPFAELIQNRFQPWIDPGRVEQILEIGTGSGCMAIAAAHAFADARVDAADISAAALEVARRNVAEHGLVDRLALFESDVYAALPNRRYDVIISNPPYVPDSSMSELPEEYRHEPSLALRADAHGLAICDALLAGARERLTDDGLLIIEVGESQPQAEQRYADLPLTWLEFEFGGEGVFLIQAQDLPA